MGQLRKAWALEQDQAIQSIVQQIGMKNWPLVSQLMKERYNLKIRSGKQCRQRWHNQLNPQLNKHPWNEEQQEKLFQAHRKYGNRWIQISKRFGGRTDNSIKNHFYSTIRRSMRRICKILGNRNSTSKLRNIRPSILSEIFQFSKTQHLKNYKNQISAIDIASCLLQYAKQKPGKSYQFDPSSKDDLQSLVNKLVNLNDEYVKFKQTKRNKNLKQKQTKIRKKYYHHKFIKLGLEQSVYSDSTLPHVQIFEKQHRNLLLLNQKPARQLKNQKPIHIQGKLNSSIKRQDFGQIQLKQKQFLEGKSSGVKGLILQQCLMMNQYLWQGQQLDQQVEQQIQIESLQEQYLIIKSLPIHFGMFGSAAMLNEQQGCQIFRYVQKPSFEQIIYCDMDQWDNRDKEWCQEYDNSKQSNQDNN